MNNRVEVALINMPFSPLRIPSIGLGLLKAALTRDGMAAKTHYFNLRFAELIGVPAFERIQRETFAYDLVGEWIFAGTLFEQLDAAADNAYLNQVLRGENRALPHNYCTTEPASEELIQEIITIRSQASAFLDDCLELVLADEPGMVGFTSVFQQHVAALALAKRIKARRPDIFIVFGGANCEGVMGYELIRQFDFVDAAVSGEGDQVFPELVRRRLKGETISGLQGVFIRQPAALPMLGDPAVSFTSPLRSLNALPIPDYDEYFSYFGNSALRLTQGPNLLFETSRGCWWGEKQHCTFCGLNGGSMTFRSKSAERALDELTYLLGKYPGRNVEVVDNILDWAYFKDFIPQLAERNLGVHLFYEVKANLKKQQLYQLRAAGINGIQPGIESFSDQVLRLMRKGVRALQNIQLLKWCREVGIYAHWNLIWGFPGESPEEYERMAELIPLLTHLTPPKGMGPIHVERFSPNFDQAAQLGLKNVAPYPAYQHVYPLPPESVASIAYFFTYEYQQSQEVTKYTQGVSRAVADWRACHSQSALFWMEKGERLLIWDWRPIAPTELVVLSGYKKFVYQACDQMQTAKQVHEAWRAQNNQSITVVEISVALDELTDQKLMIKSGESYLALAIAQPPEA